MDEEDGRPGPLAATIGHSDAPQDALPKSLRLRPTYPIRAVILSESANAGESKDPHFNLSEPQEPRAPSCRLLFGDRVGNLTAPTPAISALKEKNHENVPGK
jgi:hypothetical protein